MISWRRALRTIPCLAVLLAAGRVSAALSPSGTAAPGRQESTHRMIVKIRDRAESGVKVLSSERVSKLSASSREKLTFFRGMSGRAHVMKLPRKMSLDEAQAVAKRLMADPDVEYAEPDIRRYPALVPTDPQYGGSQWHYYAPATEKAGANLPSAWDITTGAASVVVAVLDTGILTHADIDAGRLVQGYDFISQDGSGLYYTANDGSGRDSDPSDPGDWISVLEDAGTDPVSGDFFQGCGVDDSSWHGTHVTGTIGATPNNAAYGAGVDWTSKILPVRVLGKCGGYDSDIVDGIRWAAGGSVVGVPANANPAKVINMSIQGAGMCPASYQSAINDAIAAGAVIVAAAGNAGGAAAGSPPGNCNGVITVAAVNRAGNRASYSNYGPEVEVSAPGGEGADGVYSLLNTGLTIPVADTGVELNGTSMAAPHVSGIVALMRAFNSSLTPANVLTDLQACSRPFVGGSTCDTSNCGAGMIDARGALRPGVPTGSAVTAATPNSITWTWNAVANAPSYNVYVATDPSVMLGNTAAASRTRCARAGPPCRRAPRPPPRPAR
ncbi:MAG: S8 family peptidase [Elusimicrobia bacterium]|nr:S8 family peptidase [Elusimicrobiota bacterium]